MEQNEVKKEKVIFQSHKEFWENKTGVVLRGKYDYSRCPLRIRVYDENIKGDFTHEMLDMDRLLTDTEVAYQGRPTINGDIFEFVQVDTVIPWMEAIVGCHIYSLGRGASMIAKPSDVTPENLPDHLQDLLKNLDDNPWFKKLSDGYRGLARMFRDEYPRAHTLMRGPGDMVGALLGHEKFIGMMLDVANEVLLNKLLNLCSRVYIETAKMQLDRGVKFREGYCNAFGIWAPNYNVRSQEDEASLVSPKLYNKFLLPYHIQEVEGYDYSTFHMHSGYVMTTYNWREFSEKGNIGCFEVALDPNGPTVEALLPTLIEINARKPLVIDSLTVEQVKLIEEHISEFPGAVLHHDMDILGISKFSTKGRKA